MRKVKLEDLDTDTYEFQFRQHDYDLNHVQQLVSAIERGDEMDTMTAWANPDDGKLYILAGHHRLKALRHTKRKAPVRVHVFEGSRRDARLLALQSNKKEVLPQTTAERQNAAWRLVCMWAEDEGYEYSVKETYTAAGISRGQVSNMRSVRERLHARDEALPDTWLEARLLDKGEDNQMSDQDHDALLQAQIARIDEKIGSWITEAAHRHPEALATVFVRRTGAQAHAVASFCQTVGAEVDDFEDDDFPIF